MKKNLQGSLHDLFLGIGQITRDAATGRLHMPTAAEMGGQHVRGIARRVRRLIFT